jgi:hypothetical protein
VSRFTRASMSFLSWPTWPRNRSESSSRR